MSERVGRLMAFVPTRRAALVLFALALCVFWFQALGWPMAKGRDTWDYLVYYLQLFDSKPPLSQVQLFRTPLTPLVVGLPMAIGGSIAVEVVFGLLFAVSVVAWSATALTFGRAPALASAVLLLVYPAWATLYHQASSDAVFATGLSLWALVVARTLRRPTTTGFVVLGLGIAALVLIRPANQVLLPAVVAPLLAVAPWRRRFAWVAVCLAAAVLPLAGWAAHNAIRYDDFTVTRGGRAWVPFLRVWLADNTISPENGPASRRLARLVENHVLTEEPYRSLHVPLDAYLANGSNYETVRLIALSDSVLGRDSQLQRALRLGGRGDPQAPGDVRARRRRALLGLPHAATDPRGDRTARADGARAAQADVREQRRDASEPAGDGAARGRAVRVRLVRLRLHRLVHPEGSVARLHRTLRRSSGTARSSRRFAPGTRSFPPAPGQSWVTGILNRITPRFPRPPLWIAVGVIALLWRRPRGWRAIVVLWSAAVAVLLIHAASQGLAPEFSLPLYPLFIVTALGALGGDRRAAPSPP